MNAPGAPALTVRMARLDGGDPDAYARHLVEHMAESGRGGLPHFAISRVWSRDEVRSSFVERLAKGLDEPLWGRAWLLLDGSGELASPNPSSRGGSGGFAPTVAARRVVGHLELRGGRVLAEMHRATLGMGLLRAFTAQGHGRRLLEAGIRWARDDAGLRWIDLGVFSANTPARKLYTRMGFVEVGLREDAFHLDAGPTIDDVQMTLRLR